MVLTAVLKRRAVSGETGNNQLFQTGNRDSALSIWAGESLAECCCWSVRLSQFTFSLCCWDGEVLWYQLMWISKLRGVHSRRVCAHTYTHSGTDTHCESLINFLCLYARTTSGILTSHTHTHPHTRTCISQEWYHLGFRCPMGSWHTLLKSDCSPHSQLWLVLVFRANEMTDRLLLFVLCANYKPYFWSQASTHILQKPKHIAGLMPEVVCILSCSSRHVFHWNI